MFIREEVDYINKNYLEIESLIQKHMNRCFGRTRGTPVGMITISFMNTSLHLKKPVFRFGFYEENMVWENPILEHELPADWLFHCWQYDLKTEQEVVDQRKQLRPLLIYTSAVFKYALRECYKLSNYSNMNKAAELYLCFGEHKDWQFPIYKDLSEIDIFQNIYDEPLTFRRFDYKVYRSKNFCNLDLTSSTFTNCEFSNVIFQNTILNDTIFENCKFKNVTFDNCKLYGAYHALCDFKNVIYTDTKFTLKALTWEDLTGVYRECKYLNCKYDNVDFSDCDIREVVIA